VEKRRFGGMRIVFFVANRYAVTFALGTMGTVLGPWGTMGTVLVVFTCQIKNHENRPYGSNISFSLFSNDYAIL
jgi:hypothetical protein